MDALKDNPLDPGVLEHTRTVATLVEKRIKMLKRRVPRRNPVGAGAIREEMDFLIGIIGHLHSAICDIERRLSSRP